MVHDLVVFEKIFAGEEVSFFDFFLGAEDSLADALVLDGHPLFHAEPAEDFDGPVAGEHLHEFVLEADVESAGTRIALAAGAAAKLVVDAAGGVALGADDVQAADGEGGGAEFDVGSAAGHVGGDGDVADHFADRVFVLISGHCDDLGFAFVIFGVEDFVLDAVFAFDHLGEHLAFFDAGCADENRPAPFQQIPL